MFLRLLQHKITGVFFTTGALLSFIIAILKNGGFFPSLAAAFLSGFVFVGIWAVLIKIFQTLLSNTELEKIFGFASENTQLHTRSFYAGDDNDLTASDLYQPPSNDNGKQTNLTGALGRAMELHNQENSDSSSNINDVSLANMDSFSQENKSGGNLGSDGKIEISADGKILRVTPQDAAKASRKLLVDDED